MVSFRDIKRQMRRDLHRELRVSAFYYPDADDISIFIPVTVRVHTKFVQLGEQAGTNYSSAEREDVAPRILFMRDEVPSPLRNSIVSVGPGEAYQVDHTQPPDGISISAFVSQLTEAKANGYPHPVENT